MLLSPSNPFDGLLVDLSDPVNRQVDNGLLEGCVSWWKVVEGLDGGTRWYDLVGHNHGTLTNGPAWKGAAGRLGVSIDGSDDWVAFGTAGVPVGSSARTFVWWQYQRTRADGNNSAVFDEASGGQDFSIQVALVGGSVYLFTDGVNGNNNITLTGAEIPTLNKWEHCVFAFDGGFGYSFYLNGGITATKTGTFGTAINTGSLTDFWLGRRGATSNSYDGLLDDAYLWNRGLSAQEARAVYDFSSRPDDQRLNYVGREMAESPAVIPPFFFNTTRFPKPKLRRSA